MYMRIFKLVLISFFLITSANSNSIYNLIKIPNLEIYELKTPNKLKYFYATKPFRLGVQKNIACSNSDKKTYDKKYQIISKNLNRYSKEFLKKINLKYIVMCENLSISGINTAGIPDHVMKTLIVDLKFNEKYFEGVIHHELFHIINDGFKELLMRMIGKHLITQISNMQNVLLVQRSWVLRHIKKLMVFLPNIQ